MGDLKREDEDAQLFRAVHRVARLLGLSVVECLERLHRMAQRTERPAAYPSMNCAEQRDVFLKGLSNVTLHPEGELR
jgi:hypothetical protein